MIRQSGCIFRMARPIDPPSRPTPRMLICPNAMSEAYQIPTKSLAWQTDGPIKAYMAILASAARRFLSARLRGWGMKSVHPQWEARAAICERCPLRVIRCGVSYCGTPLLQKMDRDEVREGCGCPCRDKAKSPQEHCPITLDHQAAGQLTDECSCRWCRSLRTGSIGVASGTASVAFP